MKISKFIGVAVIAALASSPASASWVCANGGEGCWEMPDGACGHEGLANLWANNDMTCFGPIMNLDVEGVADVVSIIANSPYKGNEGTQRFVTEARLGGDNVRENVLKIVEQKPCAETPLSGISTSCRAQGPEAQKTRRMVRSPASVYERHVK